MSNNIVPFEFGRDQVRVAMLDGEPWFVLNDLARVLGLTRSASQIKDRLDEGVRRTYPLPTAGGTQNTTVVNEAGMYEVVIRSDKPGAVEFRRWITGTVLPEIRKTGHYGAPAPRELSRRELALMVVEAEDAREVAERRAIAMQPKADYVDRFVGQASDAVTVDVFASQFGSTGPKVRALLHEKRVAVRKFMGERWSNTEQRMVPEYEWRPRQGVPSAEWFDLRPQHNAPRLHNGQVKQTMYVLQYHAQDLAQKLGLVALEAA
ncbi:phage antirepressor KilAC domain-containing protein [Leucobacter allii]|uniref:BRO family protein n=1 Tax=Leucobacter allii TaxID=2932247 RepID=UPI001FD36DA7|nr:BRO family protein [Leucobacter allii]UOR02009.1 phage antirepressor KilAC domain-containing protein [Leucobacter allii]